MNILFLQKFNWNARKVVDLEVRLKAKIRLQ